MWALLLFVLFWSCQHSCAQQSAIISTAYGNVQGLTTNFSNVFYGVPFAQPPVGNLRWNPPVLPNSWAPKTLNAIVAPAACMQAPCNSNDSQCVASMSEDCLYLNIFTPLKSSPSLLPVMIFIHGGCLFEGGASVLGFQSDRFVNTTNVIAVFIQYRLGIFGFLASGTGSNNLNGNYGLLDQQLAIKWVYSNIKAFGGDPTRITLFGQSAGAQSVAVHYVSSSMQPYFQGAIVESAPLTIAFRTYNDYNGIFVITCQQLGCYNVFFLTCNLTCLRGVSAQNVISFQASNWLSAIANAAQSPLKVAEPWNPVIDGVVVTNKLLNMFSSTSFKFKPLMIGTNGKEMLGILYMFQNSTLIQAAYNTAMTTLFGAYSPVFNRFPVQGGWFDDQRQLFSQVLTEWMFSCPARTVIRNQNTASTYAYVFNYPIYTYGMLNFPICEGQPCHGYEMTLLFQAMWNNMTSNEQIISQAMATYWTNFAKTQNPNTPVAVPLAWPQIASGAENYMTFNTSLSITSYYLQSDCDFWDTIGYNGTWF